MKIAVSATGPTLDADVDPRFGRCQYFVIVDSETNEFEALENSSAMAAGGAGISSGQAIAGKGAEVVLTGNCGPNAYQVLSSSGIQVITGVSGKVSEAVQAYKAGKFQTSAQANVPDHFGMGGGTGMGDGMGSGMGIGMGRGMGGGMMQPINPQNQPPTPEQELEVLKDQSQLLAQQLAAIHQRIENLEKKGK